jgi:hypothetical protein
MNFILKRILVFAIAIFTLQSATSFAQQNVGFKGKVKYKHRHKGKRERKNKTAYNPYIDHDTNKPKKIASKELVKENKKTERQQKRNIRKEKRRLRRQGKGYDKVKRAK